MSAEERIFRALADPKRQEALASLIENIGEIKEVVDVLLELKRNGVIEDLANILGALKALTEDLLTSRDFAEKLAGALEAASALSAITQNPKALGCLSSAVAQAGAERQVGIYGLLAALRDPDVQRGLGYLTSILKSLGSCMAPRR
ncbi:MAG: DUF1641 domain-containing protein [Thermoproteus sp. AZ2]|jgi:uncharacterized protein YjgD (DUF1641 family)|uniref:DUF1641 domain-containing protein n=1 Tax=Thermoproteus sp. AZ2 TaxID=1609232 RepID=A0ACC6UY06_9CREN|nr:MAG: hypothetical protein TU35_06400 [Thermoproteus sp. AZ2]